MVRTYIDDYIRMIEHYNLGCSIKEKRIYKELVDMRVKLHSGNVKMTPKEIDNWIDNWELDNYR